jgi:hypothetical protein
VRLLVKEHRHPFDVSIDIDDRLTMSFLKGPILEKLHNYGLLDNDTSDVAETHHKKDHPRQQDAIVKDLTHKEFVRPNGIATVG